MTFCCGAGVGEGIGMGAGGVIGVFTLNVPTLVFELSSKGLMQEEDKDE